MQLLKKLCLSLILVGVVFMSATSVQAAGPNPVVVFETTMGRFIVMLYPKEAPITVDNFLQYVDAGHYDGTLFHRIVKQEKPRNLKAGSVDMTLNIIQGGGLNHLMQPKRTMAPIKNEANRALLNKRGTIAMGRTSEPDSATNQFFINVEDNPALDYKATEDDWDEDKSQIYWGYCAFGKVIRGMDVVEKIQNVKTGRKGPYMDTPLEMVIITRAYRPR